MKVAGMLLMAAALVTTTASPARAQRVEIGASLVSATIGVGEDNDFSTVGIPAGGFGIVNPSLYGSIFVVSHVAIEPQLGLTWFSSGDGDSRHVLHGAVQVDYLLRGNNRHSPYVFASVGVVDFSNQEDNITSASAGGGYRFLVGDRLTFRVDGRFSRFNDDSNAVSAAASIGGLFWRR